MLKKITEDFTAGRDLRTVVTLCCLPELLSKGMVSDREIDLMAGRPGEQTSIRNIILAILNFSYF